MSLYFANIVCPNCKNPNYMVLLGDFSKTYKYKCMNCNRYFNDIDVEDKKMDIVEVVRCKDCIHWQSNNGSTYAYCDRTSGGWDADEFCSNAERRVKNNDSKADQ